MFFTLAYQAIPPGSSFYDRLKHDRAFRVLSSHLLSSGSIFHMFQYDPVAFNEYIGNEYMKYAIELYPDVFCGTELETSITIADFREVFKITCRDYPEIVDAVGSLENSFSVVRDKLIEELLRRNFEDATVIVDRLAYGDDVLGANEHKLDLISREAVKKGASILRQIESEMLFPGGNEDEKWYLESFREWKKFYLDVDDLGAEIIMGCFDSIRTLN